MRKGLVILAALPLALSAATSTPNGFTDNLDEALAAAKANGKYLYVCFSGSDWCGWCRKLEREVLSKPKFLDGVTNDYELVYIDSPQDETLLSERAKTENPKLVKKYEIHGYPTALILDSEGQVLTQTGYREGGAKKYAKHLKKIRSKGPALREEAKLVEQFITPFDDKMKAIVKECIIDKMEAALKDVPEAEQEAKEKELLASFVPDCITRVEAASAEFKALEVPEAIADKKAEKVKQVDVFLLYLQKQAKK